MTFLGALSVGSLISWSEHAYYLDYATDRAGYIEAFMNNINWAEVIRRFDRVQPNAFPRWPR